MRTSQESGSKGNNVIGARADAPNEARPVTRGSIVKRVAPKLGEVLGDWPRLRDH